MTSPCDAIYADFENRDASDFDGGLAIRRSGASSLLVVSESSSNSNHFPRSVATITNTTAHMVFIRGSRSRVIGKENSSVTSSSFNFGGILQNYSKQVNSSQCPN